MIRLHRFLYLVLAVLGSSTALADPHPTSAGTIPRPPMSTEVVLAREDLQINVGLAQVVVDALFYLENKGPATTLRVAFPCHRDRHDEGISGLTCQTRLKVWINDRPIRPRRTKLDKLRGEFFWPMRFSAASQVKLKVSYVTPIVNDRYGRPLHGLAILYYRLTTGALWAGPIGQLNMEVRLPTETIAHIQPAGYRREPGRITWALRQVEPREDLAISLAALQSSRFLSLFAAKRAEDIFAAQKEGHFSQQAMKQLAAQLRREKELTIRFVQEFRHHHREKHQLPLPPLAVITHCIEESAKMMETLAQRGQ